MLILSKRSLKLEAGKTSMSQRITGRGGYMKRNDGRGWTVEKGVPISLYDEKINEPMLSPKQ